MTEIKPISKDYVRPTFRNLHDLVIKLNELQDEIAKLWKEIERLKSEE